MTDVTVKTIDEFEDYGGQFFYAGKGLGVTGWAMNVERLPAGWADFPDHDHAEDEQEEVYIVLEGDAVLEAGGEQWTLTPGTFARVGADQKRKITPGASGVTIVALGGKPGTVEPRG